MRAYSTTIACALAVCWALAAGCTKSVKHQDIFWHGELWDGMNRMVFALEDLGFKIETVDTDKGTIVASLGPAEDQRSGEPASGQGETYRILVQFPKEPDQPILVSAAQPKGQAADPSTMRKMVAKISDRFAWYGGTRAEAREAGPAD